MWGLIMIETKLLAPEEPLSEVERLYCFDARLRCDGSQQTAVFPCRLRCDGDPERVRLPVPKRSSQGIEAVANLCKAKGVFNTPNFKNSFILFSEYFSVVGL